jgi:hypothetical protein
MPENIPSSSILTIIVHFVNINMRNSLYFLRISKISGIPKRFFLTSRGVAFPSCPVLSFSRSQALLGNARQEALLPVTRQDLHADAGSIRHGPLREFPTSLLSRIPADENVGQHQVASRAFQFTNHKTVPGNLHSHEGDSHAGPGIHDPLARPPPAITNRFLTPFLRCRSRSFSALNLTRAFELSAAQLHV